MQLLYEASEEAPGTTGLAVLPGKIRRLPDTVKRPQMQWNRLERVGGRAPSSTTSKTSPGRTSSTPSLPKAATMSSQRVTTAGSVVAVVERSNVWATQFHPEKSGRFGLAVLSRFVVALLMDLYPAIDLRGGAVVRLAQGDYDRADVL